MEISIPDGYVRVTDGLVDVGDKMWDPTKSRWIDVTEGIRNNLGFLDAMAVEELHCVIRPKEGVA